MGIGGGIFLIALGAVLSFGLSADAWEVFNVNIIGYILMGVGALALILAFAMQSQRRRTSHTEYVERRNVGNQPPPEAPGGQAPPVH